MAKRRGKGPRPSASGRVERGRASGQGLLGFGRRHREPVRARGSPRELPNACWTSRRSGWTSGAPRPLKCCKPRRAWRCGKRISSRREPKSRTRKTWSSNTQSARRRYLLHQRIVPTDRPEVAEFNVDNFKNTEQELKKSIDLALTSRPEMVTSQLEIETRKSIGSARRTCCCPSLTSRRPCFKANKVGRPGCV